MTAGQRRLPKRMGLIALFRYDLLAWKRQGFLGYQQDVDSVTFVEALKLWWGYTGVRATFIYRLSHWCHQHRVRVLPGILCRMNISRFGLDIVPSVPIGPGLYIPHPVGTVVMARGLGRNVSLITSITIGMRNIHEFPLIGNDVTIGAGARVLGEIVVGDGATIGANAVVIDNVPPGATMVGIPARPVRMKAAYSLQGTVEIFPD